MTEQAPDIRDEKFTRRGYLIIMAMMNGASWPEASEAVSSTAMEHPEWDMDEMRTFNEWDEET